MNNILEKISSLNLDISSESAVEIARIWQQTTIIDSAMRCGFVFLIVLAVALILFIFYICAD